MITEVARALDGLAWGEVNTPCRTEPVGCCAMTGRLCSSPGSTSVTLTPAALFKIHMTFFAHGVDSPCRTQIQLYAESLECWQFDLVPLQHHAQAHCFLGATAHATSSSLT